MDPGWYLAGRLLALGRLIGHNPTPDERREERELCQRMNRRERLTKNELDICLGAAAWAWIGMCMAAMIAALPVMFVEDLLGGNIRFLDAVLFGLLVVFGTGGALGVIFYLRDDLLIRSDPDHGAPQFVAKLAEKLYYPRPYDFWVAMAASLWPALRASNLLS
ncbi:hypothetical protein [Streptomyces sp. NPDC051079]|uniref:hypothetical protein n=1 Tax=Streptomyces sp. NPDC051079 TaxID=3155043 RepID=UPI00344FD399